MNMLVMKNFKRQCFLNNAEFQLDNFTIPFENLAFFLCYIALCSLLNQACWKKQTLKKQNIQTKCKIKLHATFYFTEINVISMHATTFRKTVLSSPKLSPSQKDFIIQQKCF